MVLVLEVLRVLAVPVPKVLAVAPTVRSVLVLTAPALRMLARTFSTFSTSTLSTPSTLSTFSTSRHLTA
jgi:hypothetical protein